MVCQQEPYAHTNVSSVRAYSGRVDMQSAKHSRRWEKTTFSLSQAPLRAEKRLIGVFAGRVATFQRAFPRHNTRTSQPQRPNEP